MNDPRNNPSCAPRATRRSRRGATFPEIAISTIFLALALIPLLESIVSGARQVREDRMRTFATSLASSVIERYRLETPAGCIASAAGADTEDSLTPPDPSPLWLEYRSKFELSASCTDDGGPAILRVEVKWNETGQERSLDLTTLVVPTVAPGAP